MFPTWSLKVPLNIVTVVPNIFVTDHVPLSKVQPVSRVPKKPSERAYEPTNEFPVFLGIFICSGI